MSIGTLLYVEVPHDSQSPMTPRILEKTRCSIYGWPELDIGSERQLERRKGLTISPIRHGANKWISSIFACQLCRARIRLNLYKSDHLGRGWKMITILGCHWQFVFAPPSPSFASAALPDRLLTPLPRFPSPLSAHPPTPRPLASKIASYSATLCTEQYTIETRPIPAKKYALGNTTPKTLKVVPTQKWGPGNVSFI